MRSDSKSVRSLFETMGSAAVKAWQAAPLVEIAYSKADSKSRTERGRTDALGEETFPLPWDAFVLSVALETEYICIFINRSYPKWLSPYLSEQAVRNTEVPDPTAFLCVPVNSSVLVFACGRNVVTGKASCILYSSSSAPTDKDAQEEVAKFGRTVANMAERAVQEITESSGHLTEITPANPRVKAKTLKLKPWLRDDLPRVILLNPTQASKTHGMPTRRVNERHAPAPHGRRGHWRHLQDQRIWVRPAWVGPTEWEALGQIYRVLTVTSA